MAAKKQNADVEQQEKLLPEPKEGEGEVLVPAAAPEEASPDELSKETLLPVTGMVRLSPREFEVVDHPSFQRLFEIFQLGQTNLVYRGATHMRGEHAIGCLAAATAMMDAIERRANREPFAPGDSWQYAAPLSDAEKALTRLGVLLHDIGHLPAGHTLEDELGLLPNHDGTKRIDLLLDREEWHGRRQLSLRDLIDDRYRSEAEQAAQVGEDGKGLTASQLLVRLISSDEKEAKSTDGTEFRVGVCRDIIGNTICADLIDYLHRDWMHIGKPREFDPRLLEYMRILTRNRNGSRQDRLVIHLGRKGRPRPDAVTAIMDLLESRYQLAEIALFHRVKLAATGMLERVIAEYRDTFANENEQEKALDDLLLDLLECSDPELTRLLEEKLRERRGKSKNKRRIDAAIDLARRLRMRQLHKDFHAVYKDDLAPGSVAVISERYSRDPDAAGEEARIAVRRAAENRLLGVRALEKELNLPECSVVMYCPPREMNSKIAEVGIYNRGWVDSLNKLDERGGITGGYLRALQERFEGLWRISFAIDPAVCKNLEENDLADAFRRLVDTTTLWAEGDIGESPEKDVREIAETLVSRRGSPWFGHAIVQPALNREQETIDHPGGAPSARSFISPKRVPG